MSNLASRLAALSPEKRKALLRQLQQDRGTTTTQQAIPLGEQPDTLFPRSLHAYFAQQVARTPEAIALIFGGLHISYAELDRQSDQLAVALQARGVAPEVLVAVCLDRSPLLVLALLAILKVGGAYIPLDPAYPVERLAFMLQDAQVNLLLTHTSLRTNLPQTLPQVLYLDQEWPIQPDQHLTQYPGRQDQLAYVIYTSGSTGRPKGVMATHRATINRLTWMWRTYPFTSGEVSCQKTSISFVDAVAEIFGPLLQGVPLVLIPNDALTDPSHLLALLEKHAITRIVLVPSLLRILLATEELPARLHHLTLWICSGEMLPLDLAHLMHQALPQARLFNFYGSSEVAADVTSYEFEPHHQHSLVPIGRPIANTQIYLLDTDLQPVPIGIPGDLYVGGENLARGYLNQPALTAERFLVNPFVHLPGQRLYKTGDLARYQPDGTLEYLGRADQQVKIRGHRIEPHEIEAVLKIHPAVRESVVLAREDKPGDTRLVAYLLAQSGTLIPIRELRTLVREHLPEAMLPTAFVVLEAFPHTPNGKIDRRTFPAPEALQDVAESTDLATKSSAAVRTPVEELLLGIWSQILDRPHLRIDDNFFDMGGHSLLVTQLIGQVRKFLAIEIPLRMVFEAPTVAAFAQQVEQALRQEQGSSMPPLVATQRPARLPLSFAQQRLWFLDQLDPASTVYLVPNALRIQGRLEPALLHHCLQTLVHRHESLRTTFTVQDGQPLQIIHTTCDIPLPLVDLQDLQPEYREQEARRLVREEAQRPCDLARGPLLRSTLLQLAPNAQVLLLTLHHIITDGWSMQVLVRELTMFYQAAVAAQPAPLAPLAIQYADYALWQRQWLQGEIVRQHIAYWKQQLWGIKPLQLPERIAQKTLKRKDGAYVTFHLSPQLSTQLVALSLREGVTMFMLLLATFQLLLYRYSEQEDIVVGTDVANRSQSNVEGLIGFFVNQLVLRSRLEAHQSFRELLQQVKQTTLDAYLHQDLPFEKIVEALRPERHKQANPFFSVKMLWQSTRPDEIMPHGTLDLPGISITDFLPAIKETIELDLILSFVQTPQGISGSFNYMTSLFEADTIIHMTHHLQTLLEHICTHPDTELNALEMFTEQEKKEKNMQSNKRENSLSARLKNIQPKPVVRLQQEQLIKMETLSDQEPLPLVLRPQVQELILSEWAQHNMTFLEAKLRLHGALLFRAFHVPTPADFERFATILCPDLFHENGEHVPAKEIGNGKLYTPVFYAPEKKLLWHNENSFNAQWPMKILFYCAHPAEQGGETPIVDSRKVFRLLDPALREPFEKKGVMYVRNYTEELGLSWQTVFRTTDKRIVEARCHTEAIEFEWKDGNRLKTSQIRPAVLTHPQTGEMLWWNQASHWHPSCLDPDVRASLQTLFAPEDLPRNCFYGDGTPIADEVMEAIGQTYEQAEVSFPWQTGDILLLDNMLTAHARNPYQGTRKIYVSMGAMTTLQEMS